MLIYKSFLPLKTFKTLKLQSKPHYYSYDMSQIPSTFVMRDRNLTNKTLHGHNILPYESIITSIELTPPIRTNYNPTRTIKRPIESLNMANKVLFMF